MKPLDDLKQVSAGVDLVAENDRSQPRRVDCLVVEARGNIGGNAHLPALEDDRSHAASLGALPLKETMQPQLSLIEDQRLRRADLFGSDAQRVFREEWQIGLQARFS